MSLTELIEQLQTMEDRYGECEVQIANDSDYILDSCVIDRVCFFKDGEKQRVIIVEL